MSAVAKSLTLAFGQLGDRAIVKVLLKSLAVTVLAIVALAFLFFQGVIATAAYVGLNLGSEATYLATIALTLLVAWLLFRIVALAVMQFFADEVVIAVEQCHYPECAASARKLPFREDLANSLRGAGRALLFNAIALPIALVLFFTAIGPAVVFLAVNAVLLGRELTDMGWFRHRPTPQDPSPVSGFDRILLGGAIAGMMAIPLINLLAPIVGAAAGTHLVQLSRQDLPKA